MANAESDSNSNKPKKKGFISSIVSTLFFSLLISIVIECIGITFFWTELGDSHSEEMLNVEFSYLEQDFVNSFILSEPVVFAENIITNTYQFIAVKTGLIEIVDGTVNDESSTVYKYINSVGVYVKAIINIILVFLVRLVILILSIPIFILAAIVGCVDGLVRRDIRRFGAGRESSFLYYHSKAWIKPLLILSWLIYLSVPFTIHPNAVFIPMAFLFGLSISITFGSFKKYL
ncbi:MULTISPECIES: TIGR03747 family integrating conjugative element membrane protein [unclassified Gilliamella]|uniref:TIGR03747 family integrating conjugative element membrane protein n=1 Tax=unclassified Gilliamella TaxID=2685620 RepID=UPI00080EAD3E|nr:TIGR03747 family integrating conjugative element membrane protein [Gilliamella apicola]OCG35204.1 integrating conjugative element membrane protein [Gilliamella apicola]OCG50308.1 integrating conjugative element membrane protein [Gilliamella apicola]OCG51737.1 integrating conjugative element membrane protein [Gilliamella apicola]